MKFSRKSRPASNVNLTPLIDVVFLLLIFFMVTTTFKTESYLDLSLPSASATAEPVESKLNFTLFSNGDVYLNDRRLVNSDISTVSAAIKELSDGDHSQLVVIEADGQASHQSVVSLMDAISIAGYHKVHIQTSKLNRE